MKTLVAAIGIGLALGLNGCGPIEYVEGVVTKESGTIVNIVESSGAIFGNESVKFGNPSYVLTVESERGKYILNVRENWSKPLSVLSEAIEPGDRIRINVSNDRTYISNDGIGSLPGYCIELIGKGNKK